MRLPHTKEGKDARQRRYYDIARQSKFIICPRGSGPSSIRLFEALSMGIAPVIISDAWIPAEGPKWEDFSIRIREKAIHLMDAILQERVNDFERLGQNARKAHEVFFSDAVYFNHLIDLMVSIRKSRLYMDRPYLAVSGAFKEIVSFKNRLLSHQKR